MEITRKEEEPVVGGKQGAGWEIYGSHGDT